MQGRMQDFCNGVSISKNKLLTTLNALLVTGVYTEFEDM